MYAKVFPQRLFNPAISSGDPKRTSTRDGCENLSIDVKFAFYFLLIHCSSQFVDNTILNLEQLGIEPIGIGVGIGIGIGIGCCCIKYLLVSKSVLYLVCGSLYLVSCKWLCKLLQLCNA